MTDRFVTDSSLALLARRLRLLGFDVECVASGGLEAVFEKARAEDRIVLTASARHPRRYAAVGAFRVARDPRSALRAVAERFEPESPALGRCSVCNAPLETWDASDAPLAVPADVRRAGARVEHCARCGRWYWRGSHVERMRAWVAEAMVGSPRERVIE